MKLYLLIFPIFSMFFLLSSYTGISQEVKPLTAEHLESASSEIDLDKTVWRVRPKNNMSKPKPKEVTTKPIGTLGLGPFLKWIAYLAIILLVFLIIYIIFSNIEVDKKIDKTVLSTEVIEDIEIIDAHKEYLNAIDLGDYRAAIRMQFIKILQNLSADKKINWQVNKTNRDYSRELKKSNYYDNFNLVSSIYEWVWYGKKQLDENTFNKLNQNFETFNVAPL